MSNLWYVVLHIYDTWFYTFIKEMQLMWVIYDNYVVLHIYKKCSRYE